LISQSDFSTILFSFSYIKELERTSKITSEQLSRSDSINDYLDKVLTLEARKSSRKDSIIENLESVAIKQKKQKKKEKLKNKLTVIGLSVLAGIEAGVISYLSLK
jgi:hypothetical protein